MELELRQEQQLSMRQLHSLRLLQMGRLEMREYLESVAQENPTVELELPHEEEPLTRQAERWLDRWRWLEENDRQNSYYERPNQEEEDSPMNRIGTDGGLAETLESFLCRQIAGLEVPGEAAAAALLSGGLSGGQRVPHRAGGGAGRRGWCAGGGAAPQHRTAADAGAGGGGGCGSEPVPVPAATAHRR